MNRILLAFRNSWNGLIYASRNETAFRQEIAVLVVAVPVGYWLADSTLWFLLLTGSLILLLVVELLNTSLEEICDGLSQDYMDEIKIAKDCGSAAVTLTILLAAAFWLAVVAQKVGLIV
ncbi:MAG: diacylglycerol kinase [Hyphomicrobiales bacterium]|nr:diacylglycerol kinase [Hyphomicrobiales bacterium]MCP4999663.1 diacylglycerol kinase [Hyphomicrobiales bacterium]